MLAIRVFVLHYTKILGRQRAVCLFAFVHTMHPPDCSSGALQLSPQQHIIILRCFYIWDLCRNFTPSFAGNAKWDKPSTLLLTLGIKAGPCRSRPTAGRMPTCLLWQVHSESLAIVAKWVTRQSCWRPSSSFVPPREEVKHSFSKLDRKNLSGGEKRPLAAAARCWLIGRLEITREMGRFN